MSLALATLIYEWRRYMAAIVALASAGVLVLGMTGLFAGIINSVLASIDRSPADILVLPANADSLNNSGNLPARFMPLIYRHSEVAEVRDMVMFCCAAFFKPGGASPTYVRVVVVDPTPGSPTLPTDFNETTRRALMLPFNIAVDRTALRGLGVNLGDTASLNGRGVRVAALLEGYGSTDNTSIFMSRQSFRLFFPRNNPTQVGPLMVRLHDPTQTERVRDAINAASGGRFKAWTRQDLRAATASDFLNEGIIALFMWAATALGLTVGTMITWQTLRGAILANIKEFASLRALGVPMGALRRIVLEISFWVGVVGLVVTAVLLLTLSGVAHLFNVPFGFLTEWIVICTVLLMVIALVSGALTLGVLKKSQPADLLR